MKKIALIIAFKGFQDQEYFETRRVLESAGYQVDIFSNQVGLAQGTEGGEVKIDLSLDQISLDKYQALVLIGGSGALKCLNNELVHSLIQEALNSRDLILAAICIAPLILTQAVDLKGRSMTVWSSSLDRSAVKVLKNEGVSYLDQPVVKDGQLITADGPAAAETFAQAIVLELDKLNK